MIIKALTLENFKGIAEPVRIEFKPITFLLCGWDIEWSD